MKNRILLFFLSFLLLSGAAMGQKDIYAKTTPIPNARQMYGSVVLGDYLYVIGGVRDQEEGGFSKSVIKARINPNGTLGPWEETSPLPANRSYINNTTIALNDVVYIVGGLEGVSDQSQNTVYWTRPGRDGHLEKWRTSSPHPGRGVSCSTAVATPGYIHLIGGSIGERTPTNRVWSAKVGSDGAIVSWMQGPPLPHPIWFHSAGVAGGKVWLWSGLNASENTSVFTNIYLAPILSSGLLGNWQIAPSRLPEGFYSSTCTVSGNFLLSFCPRYSGGNISNDIWFAAVQPTGQISPWKKIPSTLPSKLYIGLATDYRRGYVYLPGGRLKSDTFDMDPTVYYFRLAGKQAADNRTDQSVTVDYSATTDPDSHLSYRKTAGNGGGKFPGFISYEEARNINRTIPKPMILYFNSARARRCQEQTTILKQFNPLPYGNRIIFAELDTLHFPQIAQQYGVFRIPHWIFFDRNGNVLSQKSGILPLNELTGYLQQMSR